MEIRREPFQGIFNILRFNWHFYLIAGIAITASMLSYKLFPPFSQYIILIGASLASLTIAISILASYYIYDLSGLYQLEQLGNFEGMNVLNINAGFDETSEIIENKFSGVKLSVCDFYNPSKHTEISIKRARTAYPPHPQTISVSTDHLPFSDHTFDKTLAILSAHEIRDEKERVLFFKELNRITKTSGQIVVIEHLRDLNNFLVYTIGFLHFHSKASWLQTFEQAGLTVKQELKTTPFITNFILEKNGNTL